MAAPAPTTTPFPATRDKSANPAMNIAAPTYTQAAIAVAAFGRHVCARAGQLDNIMVDIGGTGSAGTTTAAFRLNGVAIPGATISQGFTNARATIVVPAGVAVNAGDVIDCNVTVAPTGGTNLSFAPNVSQLFQP